VKLIARTLLAGVAAGVLSAPVSFARDTGYLFVSSEKDNSVMVLDGTSYELVKTIATSARPRHLRFNPERTLLYVACGRGNAIELIDIETLELVDRIAGIDDPEVFDFSPDGSVMYISLEDAAALGILNLETYFAGREGKPELTVAEPDEGDSWEAYAGDDAEDEQQAGEDEDLPGLTVVEVGPEPEGVMVSPDGATVYVASEVANIVHVVDTATHEINANVVVGNRPRRFVLTPDRTELWVSNELSGSVTIVDTMTNNVVHEIVFEPKGFRPEEVTPVGLTMTTDGSTLYVGLGRANHIAVVDVADREVKEYVLVGSRAWNTTLNRDESLLYVVNGLSDDVSVIDTDSLKVMKSIPVGRVPYAVLIDD